MAPSSTQRSDLLLFSCLLALGLLAGLVAWFFMPPPKQGHIQEPPSTLLNRSYGTKALYLTMEQLGYHVTRLRKPYSPLLLEEIESMVLMKPTIRLTEDDWEQLKEWVTAGGRLLLVASGEVSQCSRECSENVGWFNLKDLESLKGDISADTVIEADKHLTAGDPLFEGVSRVITRPSVRFVVESPTTGKLTGAEPEPLWRDEDGLAGLRVKIGGGLILALADTYPFSNLGISEGDNIVLAVNLARELGGDDMSRVIGFDEYHHGFVERDPSWFAVIKLIYADRWGWGLTQAALAGLVALFAFSIRFGKPEDLPHRNRRRQSEYAIAAGRLLSGSRGAVEQVFPILHEHYRRGVLKALGLAADTDGHTLLKALEKHMDLAQAQRVSAFFNIVDTPSGKAELLEWISKIHSVMKEIEHGNTVSH